MDMIARTRREMEPDMSQAEAETKGREERKERKGELELFLRWEG